MSYNPSFRGGSIPDNAFSIKNAADNTKKIIFDASNIGASQVRTIIMPNANVDLGLVSSATDLNTLSTIVKRDASGNFSAVSITANLIGNVSGSAGSFTGSLSGNVTGTQSATVITDTVVTSKLITGYVSSAGTVLATDTILQAIQKLNGNIALSGSGDIRSDGSVAFTGSQAFPLGSLTNPAIKNVASSGRYTGISFSDPFGEPFAPRMHFVFNRDDGGSGNTDMFRFEGYPLNGNGNARMYFGGSHANASSMFWNTDGGFTWNFGGSAGGPVIVANSSSGVYMQLNAFPGNSWQSVIYQGAGDGTLRPAYDIATPIVNKALTITENASIGVGGGTSKRLASFTVMPVADYTALGTTTVNASTAVAGSGTAFEESFGLGDQISVSSAPTVFSEIISIADNFNMVVATPIGNGTSQTIIRRPAIALKRDRNGTIIGQVMSDGTHRIGPSVGGITHNINGYLTLTGNTGQQPWLFSRSTTTPTMLTLQGQTSGQASQIAIMSANGNNSQNSSLLIYGTGTPASTTNSEFMEMNWSAANSRYQIVANKSGTGTVRSLALGTISNPTQLLLDGATPKVTVTTGPLVIRNITMTPNGANGVDYLQTVSGSSFFNYFGTPGTGANAVILGVYGLGTSGASANIEGVRLDWNGSSKYELHTIFAGTGIARPLELFTRNSGGSDNTGQIRLNTDGSVDFGGTLGTNPYKWLVNAAGVMNLQRTTAGQSGVDVYSQLGDSSQAVSLNVYGLGLPNALTNSETMRSMWTGSKFRIATVATGTGVNRPISIETASNTDQILVNTDGTVGFGTGAAKFTDGTAALPAMSFGSETSTGIYKSGAGELAASVLGTQRLKMSNVTENTIIGTTGFDFSSPVDISYRLSTAFAQLYFRPLSSAPGGGGLNIQPFVTDGSQASLLAVLGKWEPAGSTALELVQMYWNPAELAYAVDTQFFTGIARPLKLRTGIDGSTLTGANQEQLVLNIDGSVTIGTSNLKINVAGKGLQIKEGANARMGQATLVAGTVTVSNTSVTANTRIFISVGLLSGIATPTGVAVTAVAVGTSFTITSASVLDTSTINWELTEAL